jgi:sodium-dependent dicarboxylate transporter 2/3/5
MNWVQSAIVLICSFLISRIIIDANIHHGFISQMMRRSRPRIAAFITTILIVSFGLSLFFSNTVVVLAMIPVVRSILEGIQDPRQRKIFTTPLILALIYGANIGGMGSLTGTYLNVLSLSLIEVYKIPGSENVTFFSWLLIGLPGAFILLVISRLILRIEERKLPLIGHFNSPKESLPAGTYKKYVLFFFINVGFFIVLTGLQFFFKPQPILFKLNIIDITFLIYFILFFITAFLFPRKTRKLEDVFQNGMFFLLFLLFTPLICIVETLREIWVRFKINNKKWINTLDDKIHLAFNGAWQIFFRENTVDLKKKRRNVFISVNRLVYDLPFFGLVFLGIVVLGVFILLKIGDDPATTEIDGAVFRLIEEVSSQLIPASGQTILFLLVLVLTAIFLTELVNNTTVVLIAFPLIIKMAAAMGINPLFTLLAVGVAANGAFMTPVATSVNAVAYAGIPGVSLRKMLSLGLLLNLASGLWMTILFTLLN